MRFYCGLAVGLAWAIWEDRLIFGDLPSTSKREPELDIPKPIACNCSFHRIDDFLDRHRGIGFLTTVVFWGPWLLYAAASIRYHRGLPYYTHVPLIFNPQAKLLIL